MTFQALILLAIPQGFDLKMLVSYMFTNMVVHPITKLLGVEDLGYIGINGERMFKISLPENTLVSYACFDHTGTLHNTVVDRSK